MRALLLPDLIRGLIHRSGLSAAVVSSACGLSHGALNALTKRTPSAIDTWLRLLRSLDIRVVITKGDESWMIDAPLVATPARERERRSWRTKRFISYLHAIAIQHPTLKRTEREARARHYTANEEQRIVAALPAMRERLRKIKLDTEQPGLRRALQTIAAAANARADDLAWLSGIGQGAIEAILTSHDDGRLATIRQACAALDARLSLQLPSGCAVPITRWPTVQAPLPVALMPVPTLRQRPVGHLRHSAIERDRILALYDRGEPITRIAERAGISRQRIHAMAKASGRPLRRQAGSDRRRADAERLLDG